MRLSIVIPTLNEAAVIESVLKPLQDAREAGHEVIVIDGGSDDNTIALSAPLADRVIQAPRGRARQLNAGAAAARGDVLVFLHADTILADKALRVLIAAYDNGADWAHFRVQMAGSNVLLKIVAFFMNLRSRMTHIATGDQCISCRRDVFNWCQGFPEIELMEDIEFCKRLKRRGWYPRCLRAKVTTSSRRWENFGIIHTVLLMWRLRLAYYFGADPAQLAAIYQVRVH